MTIVINFDDLRLAMESIVRENNLGGSEVKFLEVSIFEGETFQGDYLPAALNISVLDGTGGTSEIADLEEVQDLNYFYELDKEFDDLLSFLTLGK